MHATREEARALNERGREREGGRGLKTVGSC